MNSKMNDSVKSSYFIKKIVGFEGGGCGQYYKYKWMYLLKGL